MHPEKIVDLGGGVKLVMNYIPAGTFMMGSPIKTTHNYNGLPASEYPQHQVKISKGFYIGKYELTVAQWRAVMGLHGLVGYDDSELALPAYNTSWSDISDSGGFLGTLNQKNLGKFRLPTEAEWEYACRGGTTTDRYWGSANINDYCWYSGNSTNFVADVKIRYEPVGKKLPNSFGLYDMNGNVEEWCSDWYGDYSSAAATDPAGPATGTTHVVRGGDWYSGVEKCSSTFRNNDYPAESYTFRGFRVVMEE